MFKLKAVAASILLALAGTSQASDVIGFDTNGGAIGGVLVGTTTFDWQPGTAVAYGGNPSGGLAVNDIVTLRYQANLGSITDGTNGLFLNGGGGSFFTAVATFNEIVTSIGANGSATFALAPGPASFSIYVNTVAGNNLTGEGFISGTRILLGTVTQVVSGSFTISSITPVLLDQFGVDNLGGQQSVTGGGASDINISATLANVNIAYFTDLFAGSNIALSFFNTSLILPYQQVQPSNCLLDGDAAGTNNGCGNGGFARNLGVLNGGLQNTGIDQDFQFQADANQSFTRQVPEPSGIALAGLALFALGWTARRKGNQA